MFTSGTLIRSYFTVNGFDFCVDTAVIMQYNHTLDFETMLFRVSETGHTDGEAYDEMHAKTFEEAKQNHQKIVNRYTVPFDVIPSETDYSGIDRVLKEITEEQERIKKEQEIISRIRSTMN